MNAMTGYFTSRTVGVAKAPTQAQIDWFTKRGLVAPADRQAASKLIEETIAREETRQASKAQIGAAYMAGVGLGWCGSDLPGAGVREVSTQIKILQAVEVVQRFMLDDNKTQDDVDIALQCLIGVCLERFAKPMPVERRTARQEQPAATQQPAAEPAPM